MPSYPFLLVLETALNANGVGTVSYQVSPMETLTLTGLVFASTGTFNITSIRDSGGRQYTNATATVEIPSSVIPSGANANNAIWEFPTPMVIEKGNSLIIELEDSSGSGNTVTLIANAMKSN